MVRTPKTITEAELKVLRELWRSGPATIRTLTDRLYPDGGASLYATVQKLLDRLESKGFVSRERSGRSNLFTATVRRGELLKQRLIDAADQICEGSLTTILSTLVSSSNLSRDEIGELREMLDRHDSGNTED